MADKPNKKTALNDALRALMLVLTLDARPTSDETPDWIVQLDPQAKEQVRKAMEDLSAAFSMKQENKHFKMDHGVLPEMLVKKARLFGISYSFVNGGERWEASRASDSHRYVYTSPEGVEGFMEGYIAAAKGLL